MKITKFELFKGSLIASIAHAIMTNVYPELSYEQSWDGQNYSMQNEHLRGTITFDKSFCVGAIRNEATVKIGSNALIQNTICKFPSEIIQKANKETFQYLLMEINGDIVPCVTSVFWADNTGVYYDKINKDNFLQDFSLFEKLVLPEEKAIIEWKDYYDMDSNAVKLLKYLYDEKQKSLDGQIILDKKHYRFIPGDIINDECLESLHELNIYLE